MAVKNQTGEIISLSVNDESRSAEFTFNVISGDLPHGTQPQPLKLTKDSDNAYNAMVTVAAMGFAFGGAVVSPPHISVRYDDSGSEAFEVDKITIHD
jgi:hypothetical protein